MKKLFLACLTSWLVYGCSTMDGVRFQRNPQLQMLDSENETYEEYQADVESKLIENWAELYASQIDLPGSDELEDNREFTPEELVALHTPTNAPTNCTFGDGKIRGMLLIHGMYDSPYVMKDLEQYFRGRCFHTRSILLPGHGTRPANLLQIEYEAWVRAVDIAVQHMRQEVGDNVYLSGFSTGGALALNAALDHENIKGLFLFAPALHIPSWHARVFAGMQMEWVPFQKLEDKDLVKYESMTLNSVIQVSELANLVRKKLAGDNPAISAPVLIVTAKNDYTVDSSTAIQYFQEGRLGNQSEMLIYAPLEADTEQDDVIPVADFKAVPREPIYLNSRFVHSANGNEYLIADYSHMSLLLRATDSHYGLEGTYKYCLQYFLDNEKKIICESAGNSFNDICFGEREAFGSPNYAMCTERNLAVRRLTCNPRFDEMTQYIDGFIHRYIDARR